MTRAIILIFALCFLTQIYAKKFSECELVEELRRQGFPEDQINVWTCLAKYESARDTQAITHKDANADGSQDYGLFQISDRYWCSNGDSPGNGCNVRCKDLLLDDITAASQCAKKIFADSAMITGNGFSAWTTWTKCQGDLPSLPC